jgi:hypothetical protein
MQSSKLIIVVVLLGAMKKYLVVMEAFKVKERQDEA